MTGTVPVHFELDDDMPQTDSGACVRVMRNGVFLGHLVVPCTEGELLRRGIDLSGEVVRRVEAEGLAFLTEEERTELAPPTGPPETVSLDTVTSRHFGRNVALERLWLLAIDTDPNDGVFWASDASGSAFVRVTTTLLRSDDPRRRRLDPAHLCICIENARANVVPCSGATFELHAVRGRVIEMEASWAKFVEALDATTKRRWTSPPPTAMREIRSLAPTADRRLIRFTAKEVALKVYDRETGLHLACKRDHYTRNARIGGKCFVCGEPLVASFKFTAYRSGADVRLVHMHPSLLRSIVGVDPSTVTEQTRGEVLRRLHAAVEREGATLVCRNVPPRRHYDGLLLYNFEIIGLY